MPLGVGWQDCQSFAHLPTPPTSSHSSPSRTLPWSVHSHHDFRLLAPHALALGDFGLTQTFSRAPWVAKHPCTVIRILAVVLFIHGQNQSCFLLTQGLYCCAFSCRGIPSHFPSSRMVFCWIYPRSISLGGFVNRVAVSFTHRLIHGFCSHVGWETVNSSLLHFVCCSAFGAV